MGIWNSYNTLDECIFEKIKSYLGRPTCVDKVIKEGSHLEFSRLCEGMEANGDFPKEVLLSNGSKIPLKVKSKYE